MIAMDVVHVKVPEEQKETIETLAEHQQYPTTSEYIREAIRDKIERDLPLSEEVQGRIDEARETSDEAFLSKEEVEEDLDL